MNKLRSPPTFHSFTSPASIPLFPRHLSLQSFGDWLKKLLPGFLHLILMGDLVGTIITIIIIILGAGKNRCMYCSKHVVQHSATGHTVRIFYVCVLCCGCVRMILLEDRMRQRMECRVCHC